MRQATRQGEMNARKEGRQTLSNGVVGVVRVGLVVDILIVVC